MTILGSIRRAPSFRLGLALLAVGWTPLLLYIAYETLSGQTGGNPVGLGLLMFFSTPISLLLLLIGVVQGLVRSRRLERSG